MEMAAHKFVRPTIGSVPTGLVRGTEGPDWFGQDIVGQDDRESPSDCRIRGNHGWGCWRVEVGGEDSE